jgi:hypothetical protein
MTGLVDMYSYEEQTIALIEYSAPLSKNIGKAERITAAPL